MKRLLAVLLCLVMLFTLAPFSAFAAEGDQVDGAVTNEEQKTEFSVEKAYEEYSALETDELKEEFLSKLTEEQKTALLEYIESLFDVEKAFEEYSALETDEAKEEYLNSLSEDNQKALKEYIEKTEKPDAPLFASLAETDVCQIGDTGYASVVKAFEAAANGNTIKMIKDSTESATITLNTDISIILDLNGHTLAQNGNRRIIEVSAGTLTIKDDTNTGKISGKGKSWTSGHGINITGGKVVLQSGSIENCTAKASSVYAGQGGAVQIKSGTFEMRGGTINGCKATKSTDKNGNGGAIHINTSGTFNMYGGSILNCEADNNGGSIYSSADTSSFTMYGGLIDTGAITIYKGTFIVNGGSLNCDVKGSSDKKTANGGWFKTSLSGSTIISIGTDKYATSACGDAPVSGAPYTVVSNQTYTIKYENGTVEGGKTASANHGTGIELPEPKPTGNLPNFIGWNTKSDGKGTSFDAGDTVEFAANETTLYAQWAGDPCAEVAYGETTKQFYTFTDAFAEASENSPATIKLLADVTIESSTIIASGKDISINLNGKTISSSLEQKVFSVKGIMRLKDESAAANGKILYSNTTSLKTGKIIYVENTAGAQLYISSGNIQSQNTNSGNDVYIYTKNAGTDNTSINISGGVFDAVVSKSTNAVINITGGWFRDKIDSSYVAEGTEIVKVEDKSKETTPYTVTTEIYTLTYDVNGGESISAPEQQSVPKLEGYTISDDSAKIKMRVAVPYRTKTGDTYYIFDKWNTKDDGTGKDYPSGSEITLRENVTLYAQWKENDKPYASLNDVQYSTISEALAAAGEKDTVIVINSAKENVTIPEGKDVILDLNGKSINGASTGSALTNNGTLTIKDSVGSGSIYGVAQSSGGGIENAGTMTIEGGTIDGNGPERGGAIYNKGGTLTITGGIIKGTSPNGSSIYVTNNELSIVEIKGDNISIDGYIATTGSKANIKISKGRFEYAPKDSMIDSWSELSTDETKLHYKYSVDYKQFVITTTSRISGTEKTIANVSGGGTKTHADEVTVIAPAVKGFTFDGWYDGYPNGTKKSESLTYTFNPEASVDLFAVYNPYSSDTETFKLEVIGSKFKVGNDEYTASVTKTNMKAADAVTVEFTNDTEENFLYWTNVSGKVVSTEKTYTFTMGSDVTINAVSVAKSAAGKTAHVIFKSSYGQIIQSGTYTAADSIDIPFAPAKIGNTFSKWVFENDTTTEATVANIQSRIAASEGFIYVVPTYSQDASNYTVTIKYAGITKDDVVSAPISAGTSYTATVSATESDKNFQYWSDLDADGKVLSYELEYVVRPTKNITVYAVYGDSATDKKATFNIIDVSTKKVTQGDIIKDRVSFTEYYSLPEGYEVVKVGYVFTTDSTKGTDNTLLLGTEGIRDILSALKDREGTFVLNLNVAETRIVSLYVRGYIQYTISGDSKVHIMYTDISTFNHEVE